jgi:glycerate 2-kinase
MKRHHPIVVLAPDSFKGSLDAGEACAAMATGLGRANAAIEIRACPMADGGEGTVNAVLSRQGDRHRLVVTGASGSARGADCAWLQRPTRPVVVIETAEVVGITDPVGMTLPVMKRSTRGVGELLLALLDAGVRHFMVGLGGTSTNDGGAGMLCALGLRLLDAAGRDLAPNPEGLRALDRVDPTALDPRLDEITLGILADVDSPLCGEQGATRMFGPQKGVGAGEVRELDGHLARYANLLEESLGRCAASCPGAGAAGGLGFALQLIGGNLCSGAEVIADLIELDDALGGADWALTGEGQSDAQTLRGKAPSVVARRAKAARVPVTLLSGAVDSSAQTELNCVFAGCFGLPAQPMSLADCVERASSLVTERAEQLARLWCCARAE